MPIARLSIRSWYPEVSNSPSMLDPPGTRGLTRGPDMSPYPHKGGRVSSYILPVLDQRAAYRFPHSNRLSTRRHIILPT